MSDQWGQWWRWRNWWRCQHWWHHLQAWESLKVFFWNFVFHPFPASSWFMRVVLMGGHHCALNTDRGFGRSNFIKKHFVNRLTLSILFNCVQSVEVELPFFIFDMWMFVVSGKPLRNESDVLLCSHFEDTFENSHQWRKGKQVGKWWEWHIMTTTTPLPFS